MKFAPTLSYAFRFPMWTILDPSESLELSKEIHDDRIVFHAVQKGYEQDGEWIRQNTTRFVCMSCQYHIGEEWSTSEFKILDSKNIPNHIEEELEEHVRNHVRYGAWGVSYYRRNYAEAKSS